MSITKFLHVVILLSIATIFGCGDNAASKNSGISTGPPYRPVRPADQENISEVVLRALLEEHRDSSTSIFCLSFQRPSSQPGNHSNDFSDEFMERFEEDSMLFRKASECRIDRRHGRSVDRETGEPATILHVRNFRQGRKTGEVQLDAGYYVGSLGASEYRYYVVRDDGEWVVRKKKLLSIS